MKKKNVLFSIFVIISLFLIGKVWAAVPVGPTITYKGNETSVSSGNPTLEGNTSIKGGVIATLVLDARQQDSSWKAYVGNVTGSLVLEDASNFSIYEWTFSTISGEVYATRTSTAISWGGVECANSSHVDDEMDEMHHNKTNNPNDAINETFDDDKNDHWGFDAGSTTISANSCNYSINPWVNDSAQSADIFEEVLLYDGSANLIYVAKIEDDLYGYQTGSGENITYDFQMLVAENGSSGGPYQTDYYFYVELS